MSVFPPGGGYPANINTYRAVTGFFTTAANATDVSILQGSLSKVVKVTKIWLIQDGPISGTYKYFVTKRSTANTGGTFTTATSVPLDSLNPAASVSGLKAYTANPTLGTLLGNVDCLGYQGNGSAPQYLAKLLLFEANRDAEAGVLRGIAEGLAVNFNGVTLAGQQCLVYEWIEE